MPGIDAIADGGGTSDTVAFATTAPSLLVTLPFTDEVCADAADTTNRITTLVIATRNLCMFITLMTSEGIAAQSTGPTREWAYETSQSTL
jgi:hypothetical protein